jgi:hypothetical protein
LTPHRLRQFAKVILLLLALLPQAAKPAATIE